MMTEYPSQEKQLTWLLEQTKSNCGRIVYPFIAFILTVTISTLLAFYVNKLQEHHLQKLVTNKADTIAPLISKLYQDRLITLKHYIADWKKFKITHPNQTQQQAQKLLVEIPSFKLLALIKSPSHIKWVVHTITNTPQANIEKQLQDFVTNQFNLNAIMKTSSMTLVPLDHEFVIFIPYMQDDFTGYLVVFWRPGYFLSQLFNRNGDNRRFNSWLTVNNKLIFSQTNTLPSTPSRYQASKQFDLLNQKIQFDIEPTALWLKENDNNMPYLVFFLGLFYALLLGYLVFLLEQLKQSSIKDKIIRQFLESEIQEKRAAEHQLKELNLTFQLATKSAHIGVWNWDIKTDILYWNEDMFSIFGVPKDVHPTYSTWRNSVVEEDLTSTEALLNQAVEGQAIFDTYFRINRPDHQVRYIYAAGRVQRDSSGAPMQFVGVNIDVTDSIKSKKIISALELGTWELNVRTSKLEFDTNFALKMGFDPTKFSNLLIKDWLLFIHPDDRSNYERCLQQYIDKLSNFYECEYRVKNKFDRWVWVNDRGTILARAPDNQPLSLIGIIADVSERRNIEENFRFQAEHDALTNLTSRGLAMSTLKQSLQHAKETKQSLALLMIDLDGFKPINDKYGHAAGDIILQKFASRLKLSFRESDLVARVGGDEFMILLYQVEPIQAHPLINNLFSSLQPAYFYNDKTIHVTASIGVAFFPEDDQRADQLLKKADEALYKAKQSETNKVCYWSEYSTTNKKP